MVHYSLNPDTRSATYGVIGVSSAAVASGAALALSSTPLPLAAPSGLAIFGVLLFLFDRFWWRWLGVNSLLGIPLLDGYWEGTLERKFDDGRPQQVREVKVTVTQRWTAMSIVFTGQSSKSTASVISMNISDPKEISIRWIYDAHDTSGEPNKNRYGEGATRLTLSTKNGERRLEGVYYSAKRVTGRLSLREVPHV